MKSDRCWVCLRIKPEEVFKMAHRVFREDAAVAREIGLKALSIVQKTYSERPTFFCGFSAKSALSGLFYILLGDAGLRKTQREVAQSLGIVECTVRHSFKRWKKTLAE